MKKCFYNVYWDMISCYLGISMFHYRELYNLNIPGIMTNITMSLIRSLKYKLFLVTTHITLDRSKGCSHLQSSQQLLENKEQENENNISIPTPKVVVHKHGSGLIITGCVMLYTAKVQHQQ